MRYAYPFEKLVEANELLDRAHRRPRADDNWAHLHSDLLTWMLAVGF